MIQHPAAIRSKNLLAQGLIELMASINYNKITIKHLTEHVQLTRRTFYAHFSNKEDVLNYYLTTHCSELVTHIKNQHFSTPKSLALTYFTYWTKHVKLLKLMQEHQLLSLVFQNFDSSIKDIREMFGCNLSQADTTYVEYSSAFFTGILSSIISKWLETGTHETADELVNMLIIILKKFSSSF